MEDAGVGVAQLRAARDVAKDGGATDGGASLPISEVTVTYLKPAVGPEGAGFFVQASPAGPAIFVFIDPATLSPVPAVGDSVSFVATSLSSIGGLAQVTALGDWQRHSAGGPVSGLAQDLSASTDLVSSLETYESELVRVRGVVDGGFVGAGGLYEAAHFATAGLPAGNVRVRSPATVRNQANLDLTAGCDLTISSPLWRLSTQAQVHVWAEGDVTVNSCPGPTVTSAVATSPTTVTVNFSRTLAPLLATGAQFTFDQGLTASAASASGRSALVTTSLQGSGQAYTVTVASTVTDVRSTPLGTPNSAAFTAQLANVCTAPVVISQLFGGNGNGYAYDYVELHNRTDAGVDVSGWSIQYGSAANTSWSGKYTFPDAGIVAGGYLLVAFDGFDGGGSAVAPDFASSSVRLSSTSGKVALANNGATLDAGCAPSSSVIDLVGYGTAASPCFEGTAAPATTSSLALFRTPLNGAGLACFDSNTNSADFVTGAPAPRNASAAANVCTCP